MLRIDCVTSDGKLIKTYEMSDGLSLDAIKKEIVTQDKTSFSIPVIAFVGAKPAVRKRGDWQFPLSDTFVQFRQVVMGGGGGGGKNPLQMVMQIAILAVAAVASMYVGGIGIFGAESILGAGLGLGTTWAAVTGAGIMMLGTLLMGALFQQKLPSGQIGAMDAEQSSPTYSINSSGNQARLYQTEPEGFGTIKIVPDFVANTWMQYVGNDQIGYFVYGIGRGHYRIDSLSFGETVFWRNGALVPDSGYDIQQIQIVEPGHNVTIFPDNVISSDEVSGQQLFAPNDEEFMGAIGPYGTNPPGTETTQLLFDFVFQQGLGQYDNKGKLKDFTVSWRIEYRHINDYGQPLSGWAVLDAPSVTMATTTPQRITKSYPVGKGRFEARVIRTSETNGNGRTMDALIWQAMRAILPGTYQYPITVVAFSIRANNALTQNASRQFSAIVTRKLPLYNRTTKTWSAEVPTRSWAAAVSHVCKCEWGGRLKDSSIDLDTLWAIDAKLQAKNWFYDSYIDGPNLVWNLLCEMCQSQCVIPRLIGPILSFVQDAPNRPPTFALTPRNIVRNSFGVTYMTWNDDTPDDVTMEYLDAAYGYQQRDVTAKLPDSESKEPSTLDILGITDRNHAHKVAVAYAAHNRWQRIVVECQIEALGRIINKGDICTVSHPRFKNTESGAVTWWDEQQLKVGIERDFGRKIESGVLYISFTRQNGSLWGPCKVASFDIDFVTLDHSDYSTLLLQGQGNPFEWLTSGVDRVPTSWTLYTAKTYQRLMIVDSVQAQDLLHYNLKLLNYDARIYQYDNLPVPAWQGRGQLPTYDSLAAPRNLRGIASDSETLTLSWLTVAGAQWYEVHISPDNNSWRSLGRSNVNQITVTVAPGRIYARVRAANDTLQSGFAYWNGDTTLSPPVMPELEIQEPYLGGEAVVGWQSVSSANSYGLVLKHNDTILYSGSTAGTNFDITPEIQEGGPFRDLICIVTANGLGGVSQESKIKLEDVAPDAPTEVVIISGENKIILQSVSPLPDNDMTGYVIVEGTDPNFDSTGILEMRQIKTLPYTWNDLDAGIHYFRVAIKDAFFDIARNPYDLNWSEVIEANITESVAE